MLPVIYLESYWMKPPQPPPFPPCRRVRDLLTENSYQIHSNATKNFCFHSVFPHPECYLLRERRCNDGNIRVTFFSDFREWTRTIRLLPWLFISSFFFCYLFSSLKGSRGCRHPLDMGLSYLAFYLFIRSL